MRRRIYEGAVVVVIVIWGMTICAYACDPHCTTNNCDRDGHCICEVPSDTSVLDGDRNFLGGEFCDQNRTMCDGTNEFWCENESACNEIVQGENYTCICQEGYNGVHCELAGIPCGDHIFCYHNAQCVVEDTHCLCPPDWMGSRDCLLPTNSSATTDAGSNYDGNTYTGDASGNDDQSIGGGSIALLFIGLVGVAAGAVVAGKKFYDTKKEKIEFQRIQQLQMIEDDEDLQDPFSNEKAREDQLP